MAFPRRPRACRGDQEPFELPGTGPRMTGGGGHFANATFTRMRSPTGNALPRKRHRVQHAANKNGADVMAGALVLLQQLLGLAILAAGVGLAWRYWRPGFGDGADGVALTLIVTMVGGFAGAPFWWINEPASFSWLLPPLAGRMLAAAGVAFGVAGVIVLRHPGRRRVRLYPAMPAVYLAPIGGAAVALHLNRFDWAAPITYAFFGLVGGLLIAALWHMRAERLSSLRDEPETGPPTQASRALLSVTAVITGLWGIALFVTPAGGDALIWIWPADALTSRLIATMLLTLAVMAAMAWRDAALARPALVVLLVYGAGAIAAGMVDVIGGKPVPIAYMTVLGAIGLGALPCLVAIRR